MLRVLPTPARILRSASGAVAALAAALLLGGTLAVVPGAAHAADEESPVELTMVAANIYTGLTVPRFQADVSEVLALGSDFVTYNEVMFRSDAVLAPSGYGIYRDTRNRYTAANAVVWRADRWQQVDAGTYRISNWRGRPPGRQVELGRRFASWVTLMSADGRIVSVVATHVAPTVRGMPDLLRHSVDRLDGLVAALSPRGPVLVGGDFNVHYTSGRYPRDLFAKGSQVPTYDTLGSHFPTGDHHGYTIDYVFNRGAGQLLAVDHYPVELNSDHDAVVAGFAWQVDAPADTELVSTRPPAGRRAALEALIRGIESADPGSVVQVATTRFGLFGLLTHLEDAVLRGVHVRVISSAVRPTALERSLTRYLSTSGDGDSWFRRCASACRDSWMSAGVPRGFMMVSDARGRWRVRYDASRKLSRVLVQKVAKVEISTGEHALAAGERLLDIID